MRRYLIGLAILTLALTLSGCLTCCAPAPDGEWYALKKYGYFQYVNMTTEEQGRGGIYRAGKYTFDKDTITLYEINESWYPDATPRTQKPGYTYRSTGDERFSYEITGDNTLVIPGSTGNKTYYRSFK